MDRVIFDQWSHVTLFFGFLDVYEWFMGRQWMEVTSNSFYQDRRVHFACIEANDVKPHQGLEKQLWLFDTEFFHAGAQGAAVKTEDLGSTVFAAHFPLRLI